MIENVNTAHDDNAPAVLMDMALGIIEMAAVLAGQCLNTIT